MDDILETREVDGLTVNVRYDHTPTINPRNDYENLGTFYGDHCRYSSPDKKSGNILEAIAKDIGRERITSSVWPWMDNSRMIGLPVWLYDHSGTIYRAADSNPFNCKWDSGLFGVIYVTKRRARSEFGRLTKATVAKVLKVLQSEVEIYSDWANGQVFGWEVLNADGEQIDSCWGYIGEYDYAMTEAVESATHHARELNK